MSIQLFAAIEVGSYEVNLKIYEFRPRVNMREIDSISCRIDLGSESYRKGKISPERVNDLCRILREFKVIMDSYKVVAYKAYGTSAIRETENMIILLNQIEIRTGITIHTLSNSEQRFLDYKSVASKGEDFNKYIEKGTAILDISGGSIQISLFDRDTLIATQNMRIGILRLLERIEKLEIPQGKLELVLNEMISAQVGVFKKLFLKDREVENLIVVDDYVSAILQNKHEDEEVGYITDKNLEKLVTTIKTNTNTQLSKRYNIAESNLKLLFISAILLQRVNKLIGSKLIWAPGVTLCDGIAYEYAEKNKLVTNVHNFEEDIIACSKNISKRYMGNKKRGETLENIAITIYDSMKKVHGLSQRERLLLRIATILHDCGKYINLTNLGVCSYNIIMSTEIIGLSHMERKIVALVVKYNHMEFEYFEEMSKELSLDKESYKVVAKLVAILRVANALDRSHKQKFKNFRTVLKEKELVITVNTNEDITLEKGMFIERADFFEEIYSIRPVIRQRKITVQN